MSEPIKAGDLVMQTKSCCSKCLGRVFVVGEVLSRGFMCSCGFQVNAIVHAFTENVAAAPLEWLKRIPPLGELEGQPTHEDMKEPA